MLNHYILCDFTANNRTRIVQICIRVNNANKYKNTRITHCILCYFVQRNFRVDNKKN